MANKHECPICGEGTLTSYVKEREAEYKGQKGTVERHYSVCDACGSEQAGAAEMKANKRAVLAFRKHVDGLLTGAEVLALRKLLGVSQSDAGRMFGGGPVAFSKYENDDVVQSEPMNNLLKVSKRFPMVAAYLAREAGVELKDHDHLVASFQSRSYVANELGHNRATGESLRTLEVSNCDLFEVTLEEFQHAI